MDATITSHKAVSVLDPVRHARLLQDIDHLAHTAGVAVPFIKYSMIPLCDSIEIDFVTNFRLYKATTHGLLLIGKDDDAERCFAMCGAFVRNFIDARVMTLTQVLDKAEDNAMPDPTVLIIPNFYNTSFGKTLPAWKLSALYDVLLRRGAESRATILAMDSFTSMKLAYGANIASYLRKFKGAE